MLKLPKGLKKKKKKSKKDQELFTEEELEQYKREQRLKQEAQEHQIHNSETEAISDAESVPVAQQPSHTASTSATTAEEPKDTEDDEEWSKFKLLTAGLDSVLHKTQDDLDRIKQTSFFQRVLTPSEKKKLEEEEAAAREAERLEQERLKQEEFEANRDKLAEAVVQLSDSEEESEEADDIFNTEYIDAITSGELQLTVVPDSPVFELNDGPDPFDTSYAEKVIVGANKAKSGKKLVSLGAAVEVLSGRVDREHALALSAPRRKPRKGVQDLLGDENSLPSDFLDDDVASNTPEPPKSLLDDLYEDVQDTSEIDLSVSLHLQLLQNRKAEHPEDYPEEEAKPITDFGSEFDTLNDEEDDEFAELAAESLTKKEEVIVLTEVQPVEVLIDSAGDWAEFEQQPEEEINFVEKQKPSRPPPPSRPATGPHLQGIFAVPKEEESDNEFVIPEDDPFDTTFVEKVIPVKDIDDDDFDFDPRADEKQEVSAVFLERNLFEESNQDLSEINSSDSHLKTLQKDFLGGSTTDLSSVGPSPIAPQVKQDEDSADFDPFDTSSVVHIVQPKELELKFLEKELLADSKLNRSLSDPDFDPRASDQVVTEEPIPISSAQTITTSFEFDAASRKSSLSLNLHSKTVGFLVPETDLLSLDHDSSKSQKPLTPYYFPNENSIEETPVEDPFDTSFVPEAKPTEVELKNLEQDLLNTATLKHSLSDPDFDPRADVETNSVTVKTETSDLLAVDEPINIKVLTPSHETKVEETKPYVDPFDTSIAANINPGKAELKLLENEFLPASKEESVTVLDALTDAQELGLGDKVLTPQVPANLVGSIEEVDPFDTSIAENLGPGKAEIKVLENELIHN